MDAEIVLKGLKGLKVPVEGAVTDWRIRMGMDSTDDPAVWVYVFVDDPHIEAFWPIWADLRRQIRETVESVAEAAGEHVNTYVRMRAASETRELQAASA
jgi:hypothetical protein